MAKTIEDYIKQFIFDNGKSQSQLPPANVLARFNRRMHELEEEIVTFVNNDLYDEGIRIDLIAGQNKYLLPSGNSQEDDEPGIPQLKKLLEVSVKYNSGLLKPTKCTELSIDNLDAPLEYFETKQEIYNPKFRAENKSIVIYPTPTEDIEDGLTIRYAKSAIDASLSDTEDSLPFGWFYINTILVGMSVDLAKANKDRDIQLYMADRERTKRKTLSNLSDRYITATNFKNPNLTHLMY